MGASLQHSESNLSIGMLDAKYKQRNPDACGMFFGMQQYVFSNVTCRLFSHSQVNSISQGTKQNQTVSYIGTIK